MQPRFRFLAFALCCVAVWICAAFACAPEVFASEEPAQPEAPKDKGLAMEELEERLFANPVTTIVVSVLRFAPLVAGLILITLWFLKREKIKVGMLPPPERVKPTEPYTGPASLIVMAAAMLFFPVLAGLAVAPIAGYANPAAAPMWVMMVAAAVGGIPVALLICLRRKRMADATVAIKSGFWAPPADGAGTSIPKTGPAIGYGLWALCIATLLAIPVAYAWGLLLSQFGFELKAQEPVVEAVKATGPGPWVVAVFGVLVAPFVEESVFRGVCYPAVRRMFGGTRRAAWISAVIVSGVFAAIHGNIMALAPLFVLAMVLTWIFETTNSLAAVVVTHALFNLSSIIPLIILRYS